MPAALGMESRDISDFQLSSSSVYDIGSRYYPPWTARPNYIDVIVHEQPSFRPIVNDGTQWIQVGGPCMNEWANIQSNLMYMQVTYKY